MFSLSGWNYAKVICVWELSDGCHYSLEKKLIEGRNSILRIEQIKLSILQHNSGKDFS